MTFVYSSTCFGSFPAHHQELNDCSSSLWFYLRIVVTVVLCSRSGQPARPRTQKTEKFLHHVGNLSELNVKLWCQKFNVTFISKVPVLFFLRFRKITENHY
jgi:hypothetical protein